MLDGEIFYTVKRLIPNAIKQRAKSEGTRLRGLFGTLPDFIIVGAQRCGTTSLYNYLVKHPCIASATKKELHFFDQNFCRGLDWYRAQFPALISKAYLRGLRKQPLISGESSPYYLFHPLAPSRIYKTLPNVKLIVMLRDPVDRAFSQYKYNRKKGYEELAFEEAIAREAQRLNGEAMRIQSDHSYRSFRHQHYSYLSRGIYVEQLTYWLRYFAREQFLILKSEEFFSDTDRIFHEVLRFLDVPNWTMDKSIVFNSTQDKEMSTQIRNRLTKHFDSYNRELYELLNRDFGWSS